MSEPMTDERATQILEMQRERENAPMLWAEVRRLCKDNTKWLKEIEALLGEQERLEEALHDLNEGKP